MAKDPVEDFHMLAKRLREENVPFAIATVIEVQGSASAMTGSKAIFDSHGKNLLGWVGGGCAERFIGEQANEALTEGHTRIVLADLDDEVFGLGVACGGTMRVFIDPIFAAEQIRVPKAPEFQKEMQMLAGFYGWQLLVDETLKNPESHAEVLLTLAKAIGGQRKTSLKSLRETKDLPTVFTHKKIEVTKKGTLVGRSRITEALQRHFNFLNFETQIVSSSDTMNFQKNEIVIVASHTAKDPQIVEQALAQNAGYVAMVGSRKRALEVIRGRAEIHGPLFIPAGLDIHARNPDEIALSIVAEILTWI